MDESGASCSGPAQKIIINRGHITNNRVEVDGTSIEILSGRGKMAIGNSIYGVFLVQNESNGTPSITADDNEHLKI